MDDLLSSIDRVLNQLYEWCDASNVRVSCVCAHGIMRHVTPTHFCIHADFLRWVPPIARIPPLMLTRLMAAIDKFIVFRGGRGKGATGRLISLFHRQFREVAHARYVSGITGREVELHSILADYFSGKHHAGKPYSHPNQERFPEEFSDDRLLPASGLFIGEGEHRLPNARRAGELVYHLIRSTRLEEAAKEVYGFVCAMAVVVDVRF